ncbi:plasminogen activator, urokinase a isoform X1 [Cyprinodon tularosa]|uniref:plasminogen activator, urokinase a isoform X1 n=1 Tax=Cyprinodon tularosa TaxID=77115 RepID=UPI0018E1DB95|nr:plasminogen activator, urokinase a isoform X1 [Cyprinodon tularosa]
MMKLLIIFSICAALSINMVFSLKFLNNKECLYGKGRSYRGTVSRSSNGRRCLSWSKARKSWLSTENHNYCRNPNNNLKPWCYVRKGDRIVREFCDIPKCFKPTVNPTTTPTRPVDTEWTCGERSAQRMNKIVGGSFIPIESHPWIAAIYQRKFLCGGSLISPNWVLTAAHCFVDGNKTRLQDLSVYLGKTEIKETDPEREQVFTVEKLIIHHKYNEQNFNNDMALLKISNKKGQGAFKTDSVRTVCLPPFKTYLPPGFPCSIAGFGMERFGFSSYSNRLKKANVNLLSSTDCKHDESYKALFTDNMICAASPDWSEDACKGDSGGPLVCEVSGRMFLFGVVSWGDGCASENKPGVYTKVTNYNNWIAKETGLIEYTKGLMYPQK